MKAGSWKLEAGSRKLEAGSRKLEAGSWKPEAGSRKPEAGSWKLEAGSWKLEAESKTKNKNATVFCLAYSFQLSASGFLYALRRALYEKTKPVFSLTYGGQR